MTKLPIKAKNRDKTRDFVLEISDVILSKIMSNPEAITDLNPKPPSDEITVDPPDHFSDELSDHLGNVGLDEINETVLTSDQKDEERESSKTEKRMIGYPLRPDVEDCSFYMRTGSCKYGPSCKFNHPLRRKLQIGSGREKVREREEDVENSRLMDCKYYFRTGGCKYGESCRFNHKKEHNSLPLRLEFNFLGLPIRHGEKECPFYMRNGSCKFGSECRFNHPDPTAVSGGGVDSPLSHGSVSFSPEVTSQATWSPSRLMNGGSTGTAPFIPVMYSQNRVTAEWNGHQASMLPPSTYSMAETSSYSQYQHQQQIPAEEFPERPDQPECSYYLKTGDCKFKYKCKYNHPKNRLPKQQATSSFNDKGLPLRPDQSMCTHYSRYGICKFGPACRFDHSTPPTFLTSSSHTVEATQVSGNGDQNDGWN